MNQTSETANHGRQWRWGFVRMRAHFDLVISMSTLMLALSFRNWQTFIGSLGSDDGVRYEAINRLGALVESCSPAVSWLAA